MIEIRDLHKRFGHVEVLKGIDLDVDAGKVVCVIGPSGSGKSTLLRCLNLLEEIDDGVITFEGREISDPRIDPRDVANRRATSRSVFASMPHTGAIASGLKRATFSRNAA